MIFRTKLRNWSSNDWFFWSQLSWEAFYFIEIGMRYGLVLLIGRKRDEINIKCFNLNLKSYGKGRLWYELKEKNIVDYTKIYM